MDIHGPLSQARKWFPFFAVCVIGFGLTMPTALCGYHKGDTIHLVWAKHFSEQFWAGELYPRWLFRMNSGLGSPTFYFYGPIPYYFTAVIYAFIPDNPYGWLQTGLSAALALGASGVTAYIWLSFVTNRFAAYI